MAGIGVLPVTETLANSGIQMDNGVLVNEYLETTQPDIWAAGDVANYQDALYGKRRRVEHWDNAVSQGQHCARTLLGERAPFVHVPYFFSDVFDLHTNSGAILPTPMRSWSAATFLDPVSAYGGCGRCGWWPLSR